MVVLSKLQREDHEQKVEPVSQTEIILERFIEHHQLFEFVHLFKEHLKQQIKL